MSYTGQPQFLARARQHQMLQWLKLNEFTHALNIINRTNFAIGTARQEALDALNAVIGPAPYSVSGTGVGQNTGVDIQFPEDCDFIAATTAEWVRMLQQLRAALAFKDRMNEVTARSNAAGAGQSSNTPNPTIMRMSYDDSLSAFYNAISQIWLALGNQSCVYYRQKFESEYRLTWVGTSNVQAIPVSNSDTNTPN